MIQKFITQEETHKSLVGMTKESQAKIEEIAQQKEAAQRRVTEAKYNAGAEEAAPVAVNVTERAKLERQRHKLERLTQVMISVKAGVQHLAEGLDGVKVDAPPPVAVGDASLVPVLQRCEAQLRVVLEAIRQEEEALVRDLGEAALQKTADVPAEPPVVNNNRVKEGMGGEEEAASEEEFEEDLEEEVVEREALKKQSGTILDRATKGRKKKRGGKKEAS